jgi:hypothetical protein
MAAAMVDQLMAELDPAGLREDLHQIAFDLYRI